MQSLRDCRALREKKENKTVAIYRLEVKAISRSAGQSAVAKAAYRTRANLVDERTGQRYDYRRRGGIGPTGIVLADGSADISSSVLWNAAETAENRKNSTVAREIILALPHEMDAAGHERLVRSMLEQVARRHGVAGEYAIHAPNVHPEADQKNHHAHVMLTTRRVDRDEAGQLRFGAKTRELDDQKTGPAEVTAWRELWEREVNAELQRIGAPLVSAKSLAAQGIDRRPQERQGPRRTAMLRKAQPIWRRERAVEMAIGIERSTVRGARDLRKLRHDRQERLRTLRAANNTVDAAAQLSGMLELAASPSRARKLRGLRQGRQERLRDLWTANAAEAAQQSRQSLSNMLELAAAPSGARGLRKLRQARQERIEALRAAEVPALVPQAPLAPARPAQAPVAPSRPSPAPGPSRKPLGAIVSGADLNREIPDKQERAEAIQWLAMKRLGDNAQRTWRHAHNRTSDDVRALQQWWIRLSDAVQAGAETWAKKVLGPEAQPSRGEGPAPDPRSPPGRPHKPDVPGR